ncbi:MAG TPA: VOC family protein [Candidatus Limnocylindrales bacterium]
MTGGYFAVSVADLDASQRWYEEKLGLDVVLQPPAASGVAIVVLRGEGLIVELIHQDTGVSPADVVPALADRTLLHGFAKAGAIVGDLDAVLAQLRARGVPIKFGPYAATSDQPANLIIEDNEGNLIQFIGS